MAGRRYGLLGHGSMESNRFATQIETFKNMRVANVSCGNTHCAALSEQQVELCCFLEEEGRRKFRKDVCI